MFPLFPIFFIVYVLVGNEELHLRIKITNLRLYLVMKNISLVKCS